MQEEWFVITISHLSRYSSASNTPSYYGTITSHRDRYLTKGRQEVAKFIHKAFPVMVGAGKFRVNRFLEGGCSGFNAVDSYEANFKELEVMPATPVNLFKV